MYYCAKFGTYIDNFSVNAHIFIVPNGLIMESKNLAIWSHCSHPTVVESSK